MESGEHIPPHSAGAVNQGSVRCVGATTAVDGLPRSPRMLTAHVTWRAKDEYGPRARDVTSRTKLG